MKNLIIAVLILSSLKGFSQQLFNGLSVGMTKKEAKAELKANDYKSIELGNAKYFKAGVAYDDNKKVNRVWLKPNSITNGLFEAQAEVFFKEVIFVLVQKGYTADVLNSNTYSSNTTQLFYSSDGSKSCTVEVISFDNDPIIRFFVNFRPFDKEAENNKLAANNF
tara:strand:- start:115 stop:609 length:495 start_codon:yes stop_codon:yes gene_type:complete